MLPWFHAKTKAMLQAADREHRPASLHAGGFALHVRKIVLKGKRHESLETVCLPDREGGRRKLAR